ncbi:hypothetical protein ACWC3Y_11015 [Streptomyces sp. NPDC001296]
MTEQPVGPRCGNNPNARLTDGDRNAVADFKARLALQAAIKPYVDAAAWVGGDPLMEVIAATVWDRCRTEGTSLVVDDPRNIAAVAAAVARAAASAVVSPPTGRAAVARVRALHQQYTFGDGTTDYCAHCNQIRGGWVPWPCPTVRALDVELAVEAHDTGTQQPEAVVTVHTAPNLSPAAEEALSALVDVAKRQFDCDFEHPHPEHPCGRRVPAPVAQQPAAEDTCRPVEIDGEIIRVRGAAEMSEESRAALAEVIAAAKRRYLAEHPEDEQQPAAADGEDTRPSPTAVLLATRCDTCQHTLNWHRNDVGCTVPLCVCGRFQPPTEEPQP